LTSNNTTYKPVPANQFDTRRHHSVSKQMYERFERRKLWRRSMAVLYMISLCAYLMWRYTIIDDGSLVISVTYFIAECIGFLLGLVAIATSWSYNHRDPKIAPSGLSVDIFVPTYKEPLEIIRRTLMAAKDIEYPHKTWVLDDGNREEVKALAQEIGLPYLSRPVNEDAKAGNLNYGLKHSEADYLMVFDADHIALPHALDVMLGFFDEDDVGMVQTPQDYYNVDAFQYMSSRKTGGLWHDQSFFYNIAQPCRDGAGGASCVGTGVVYRRGALDKIGGFPTKTVTEDIHTSLKMCKSGYQVVNINEPIAYGVAAADLAEYYKTRHRWASGNLHALSHENIVFCKGLTLRQRFSY
jgi:cellulose synthase (UDP-forming)